MNDNIEYGIDFSYFYESCGRDESAFRIPSQYVYPHTTFMDHIR